MEKFKDKYRIPSARLQNWDYTNDAAYFITICTKNRECLFGYIENGNMQLSNIGVIADILWYEISNHASNVELGEFIVMPNHIHGILILNGNDNNPRKNDNGSVSVVGPLPQMTPDIVETLHATSLPPNATSLPPNATSPKQEQPFSMPNNKNEFMAKISPKPGSVSTIIRSYKSAVTKHAHRLGFEFEWQERFHDHIIRDDAEYQRIANYIATNPLKWEDDKFYINNEKYKNSGVEWIGEIPEHWNVKKFNLVSYMKGRIGWQGLKQNEFTQNANDPFLITGMNFKNGIINWEEVYHISDERYEQAPEIQLKDTDVLITKDGTIGKLLYVDSIPYPNKASLNSHLLVLRPLNNSYNPRFLYYQLQSLPFKHHVELTKTGTTFFGISQEAMGQYRIILPKIEEQKIIANYLDKKTSELDRIIANKQKLIALYEEEKQAVIDQAVTKGLDTNVKFKDSGVEWLDEIPEHWEVRRFSYLFSFSRGLSITKENLKDVGIPCINYGEIHSKYGFEVNPEKDYLKCVDEKYVEMSEKSLLKRGDFIFADTSEDISGSGNFTYLNSDISTFAGYHTIVALPKENFITRYVAYFFNSIDFRNQIRCRVTGTKVYSITQSILKYTNIALPPTEEQTQISAYIDKECCRLNKIIEKLNKQIDLLQEYRTTLISDFVTGKIKVPNTIEA